MTTQLDHIDVAPDGFFAQRTGHEQVVFCQDERSGLKAIIAIYSTALGPSLGGTRFYPYPDEDAALADVLKLSRAMAYKSAVAGLDLGGGKAVIIGDPAADRSEALLRAYGRFVQSLGGRYITACDVGTYASDMDVVATETKYVTGRSEVNGGAGDSSTLTSHGVSRAMQAAVEHLWGSPRLLGRRVGVEGVGKVGAKLVEILVEAGAAVVVCDPDERALARVTARCPDVQVVPDAAALRSADLDVYAPCALGGSLTEQTVGQLSAKLVCGGANNQLATPGIEKTLRDNEILYVPDYVANAGGLIQVADEIGGFDFDRARNRTSGIYETTRRILATAAEQGVTPGAAADQLAERRMSEVSALRSIHVRA